MSRYGSDRTVRAEYFDPDEDVTFWGKLSFLQMHTLNMYRGKLTEVGEPTTEEGAKEYAELMCRSLFIAIRRWRLREPDPTYEDASGKGVERAKLALSLETLINLPSEDIAYLYGELFPRSATPVTAKTADELELAETHVTPAAEEAGLTPATFSDLDPDPVDLPGRRRHRVV